MIRAKRTEPPLFYNSQEIARPAAGNFYARLEKAVRDWEALAAPFASAFCASIGRPTDPVVFLKIFLIAYLENITYDTDLAERIQDSLALRAFLGYGLEEHPPDHSSISRNRAKISTCCNLEELLTQVVARCERAGLVSGEAAVDSSLIPANASLSSLRSLKTGKGVREHLREVRARNQETGGKGPGQVSNEEFRSTTDPDARIAKRLHTPRDMYYKAIHVTDAKAGIILAAEGVHACGGEAEAAQPIVLQAQANLHATGQTLATLIADAGYDDADFHAFIEGLGATPLTNSQADGCKPQGFRKADFTYDARSDSYQCPRGRRASYFSGTNGERRYITQAADCALCPSRGDCIGKGTVRQLKRGLHEESRERNRTRGQTVEGRAMLKKRKHIVEPPFGHMKTYGGLGLMNCRGLRKARVKVILAALAWNLKKLVKALTRDTGLGCSDGRNRISQKHIGTGASLPSHVNRLLQEVDHCGAIFLSGHITNPATLGFPVNLN